MLAATAGATPSTSPTLITVPLPKSGIDASPAPMTVPLRSSPGSINIAGSAAHATPTSTGFVQPHHSHLPRRIVKQRARNEPVILSVPQTSERKRTRDGTSVYARPWYACLQRISGHDPGVFVAFSSLDSDGTRDRKSTFTPSRIVTPDNDASSDPPLRSTFSSSSSSDYRYSKETGNFASRSESEPPSRPEEQSALFKIDLNASPRSKSSSATQPSGSRSTGLHSWMSSIPSTSSIPSSQSPLHPSVRKRCRTRTPTFQAHIDLVAVGTSRSAPSAPSSTLTLTLPKYSKDNGTPNLTLKQFEEAIAFIRRIRRMSREPVPSSSISDDGESERVNPRHATTRRKRIVVPKVLITAPKSHAQDAMAFALALTVLSSPKSDIEVPPNDDKEDDKVLLKQKLMFRAADLEAHCRPTPTHALFMRLHDYDCSSSPSRGTSSRTSPARSEPQPGSQEPPPPSHGSKAQLEDNDFGIGAGAKGRASPGFPCCERGPGPDLPTQRPKQTPPASEAGAGLGLRDEWRGLLCRDGLDAVAEWVAHDAGPPLV